MGRRGFGLKLEAPVGLPLRPHLGAAGDPIPSSASIEDLVDKVRDQGPTEACVAFWLGGSLEIEARAQGIDLGGEISRRGLYTMAREEEGLSIVDTGSLPSLAVFSAQKRGIVSELRWPWSVADINELLPWDVFQHAVRVTGIYRAEDLGAVQLAIVKRRPVGFDMVVDESYYHYTGGLYVPGGRVLGRHMQTIVGYEPGRYRVLGSWGPDFGEKGYAWVPESIVDIATSRYVVSIAPQGVE
jgi:C1A family cysteine protease